MSWMDHVRKVTPYTPGEQPEGGKVIKLNTNENPYPPSPAVREVLAGMNPDLLRKYPDPDVKPLRQALAQHYGVKPEQVFVGVGSDDVLAMSFLTFFNGEAPVFFPDITYSFYDVWADLLHIPYETKALDENFRIRPEDYFSENGGVVFPNPNAPTGLELPQEQVRQILDHNRDVAVIVDEAYVDFGARSVLPLIDEYENLLVVQTFSKSRSMAGMRIGFAIGSEKMIACLCDVRNSFNSYTMNLPSQLAGVAAVRDEAYFHRTTGAIVATRERTKAALRDLGFSFCDSKTNFLFVTHKNVPAAELFKTLRENGIFVRYFDKPRISNYLRITIGTDQEMDALLTFLRRYLQGRAGRRD